MHMIRRATAADAATLADMRSASHAERYTGDARRVEAFRAECLQYFERELARDDGYLRAWLAADATKGDRLVGTASLTLVPTLPRIADDGRQIDARVRNVYVLPDARRRGVARALMQILIDEVKASGLRRVTLGTSVMGRSLYESLGFRDKDDEMQLVF